MIVVFEVMIIVMGFLVVLVMFNVKKFKLCLLKWLWYCVSFFCCSCNVFNVRGVECEFGVI